MQDISIQELRLMMASLIKSQQETDLKFKETDLKFKETDLKIDRLVLENEATAKAIKNLSKEIGGIGNKFGSFTEGLAYPSLRKILYKKYKIDNTVANFQKRLPNGKELEYDAFGYTNGNINNAVVVEVKSELKSRHIGEFVHELRDFKKFFPEYGDKHLYGILATVCTVPNHIRQEINEAGLQLAWIHDNIFDLQPNENAIDFNEPA